MRYITNALTRLIMGRLNYWFGVLVDALLAGGFLVHAMRTMHGTWVTTGVSLLAGLGLYGFLEYGVHRWAYHDDRSPATPGHRLHHDDPEALIAVPFFVPAPGVLVVWRLLRSLLGDEEASVLIVALVMSVLYYGPLHHGLHHGRLPARYFRILRGHHRIHHQFPDCNFGGHVGSGEDPDGAVSPWPSSCGGFSRGSWDGTSTPRTWRSSSCATSFRCSAGKSVVRGVVGATGSSSPP